MELKCNCSGQINCLTNAETCILKLLKAYATKILSLPEECLSKCPQECDRFTILINKNYLGIPSNKFWSLID